MNARRKFEASRPKAPASCCRLQHASLFSLLSICYGFIDSCHACLIVATMCYMKQSVVRARIDNDLKAEASALLESCGLGLSDAIRIFLRQVVKQGGLPFR